MRDKIILITGATSGIGKITAIELAKKGANIIFLARCIENAEKAIAEIKSKSNNSNIDYEICNLASFKQIKATCEKLNTKYERIDILINNAGTWETRFNESLDGIEQTFAVNYLAPFLLCNLLLPMVEKSKDGRIINTTSGLHQGKINFADIEYRKKYSGYKSYRQSKLALILFTKVLAIKLKNKNISVNSVSPGMNITNLGRNFGWLTKQTFKIFGKNPSHGANVLVHVACNNLNETTGECFSNFKIKQTSKHSYNLEMAQKLWNISEVYLKDYLV